MNQFHSSSDNQLKNTGTQMGYKSSQTIAAISWKTLHHNKKKIYSPLENISKQNQCSAESIQTMA